MVKAKEIISKKVILKNVVVVFNGLYEAKKYKGKGIAKYSLTVAINNQEAKDAVLEGVTAISESWTKLQTASFIEAKLKELSETSAKFAPLAVGEKIIYLNSVRKPKVTDTATKTLNPKINGNDIVNVLASFTYYPEQPGTTVGFTVHAVNLVKKNSISILDSIEADSDVDWLAVNNVSSGGYSDCVSKEEEEKKEVEAIEASVSEEPKKVSASFWGTPDVKVDAPKPKAKPKAKPKVEEKLSLWN